MVGSKGRTLSTAREVLRVLRFLQQHPGGVTSKQVAEWLGKSLHTAYYLLTTLCHEGFAQKARNGRYYHHPDTTLTSARNGSWESLKRATRTLNRQSGCRSYLVTFEDGEVYLLDSFGHQGQPGPKGLGTRLTPAAHALAVGKAVLALLGNEAFSVLPEQLTAFTPRTLDRAGLARQLAAVRRQGLAVDLEEYQEGICCLAVPVRIQGGAAALGIAVARGRFMAHGEALAQLIRNVAKEA